MSRFLSGRCCESDLKALACARQPRHHRTNRDSGDIANFLVAEAFELAEHDGFTKFHGKFLDCVLNATRVEAFKETAFGIGGIGLGGMNVFVEFIREFLPAILAQPGEASIPDDGQKPAATIASAKRGETSPGAEARFLDQIFGVRGAAQEPAGEVMGRMEMRKD